MRSTVKPSGRSCSSSTVERAALGRGHGGATDQSGQIGDGSVTDMGIIRGRSSKGDHWRIIGPERTVRRETQSL